MFNLLEKLRNKSNGFKKRFAFVVALSVSGLVFVMWLSVIYPDFRKSQSKEAEVAKLQPGPVSVFSDSFLNGIKAITDKFSEVKTAVSGLTANATYYSSATSTLSASVSTTTTEDMHSESVSTTTSQ